MTTRHPSFAARLTALMAAAGLLIGLGACSSADDGQSENPDPSNTTVSTGAEDGAVAIFTPADGITISQHTPLNKWAKLVPEITDALEAEGMSGDRIESFTSDSLDRQSRAVQDYVVDHLSADGDDDVEAQHTTLLVAPVVQTDDSTRQYGDYIRQELAHDDEDTDGAADGTDADSSEDDNDTADGSDASGESLETDEADPEESESERVAEENRQAADRLVSALRLAQESGMHVVLMANTIEGYAPDAFVSFSDARSIGQLQAQNLAAKLELDKVSKDNPKYVEVMLPYDPQPSSTNGDETDTDSSATFAQEAFAGIWSVLGPYFESGVLRSPSGILTASSTADDWSLVAYDASEDNATGSELANRLDVENSDSGHTRIDGVIAMNDYVASDVIDELEALGYTGSAADINPSITISGIVDNITGKKDLAREAVPDPIKAPDTDDADADTRDEAERDAQWPLVTGYGAYVDSMPDLVSGKQWMTGLEDRKTLAEDTARACVLLNTGKTLDDMESVSTTTIADKETPTISESLLAVSASNLKAELITPGYITMAEAGL
ncbi:hypothetical protein BLEM_2092 [Bifidobacterium lemurum]|uniref:Periplasmic binding protein domain-containing protein n=1 Tax=Bifidobacterium lemurum TaxID=1603886 RepID=A0A261FL98_9BIFI|nr:hypothetical protein [Bifidobacterium lemurum]OZG59917.1 hypothetical protein BLEM_2092 [Bifidobacterium lemurum]QOL33941.1 hypothetical protein BL8807_09285 [Bifidobacterium lemurum]